MKKAVLFLIGSFFTGFLGMAANVEVATSKVNNHSFYDYTSLFYAVMTRSSSPELMSYFIGKSLIVNEPRSVDGLEKSKISKRVLSPTSVVCALAEDSVGPEFSVAKKINLGKESVIKRQVSFSDDTKREEDNSGLDSLRINIPELRRISSDLRECHIVTPSPPSTPAKDSLAVRSRVNSEDSANGFYLACLSEQSTPVATHRKHVEEDAVSRPMEKDTSFYGSCHELRDIEKTTIANKRLGKQHCKTPNITPVTSPDTKN